jgi:hypothetical protein
MPPVSSTASVINKLPIGSQVWAATRNEYLVDYLSGEENGSKLTTIVGYGKCYGEEGYVVLCDNGWPVPNSILDKVDECFAGKKFLWIPFEAVEVCPQCGKKHP